MTISRHSDGCASWEATSSIRAVSNIEQAAGTFLLMMMYLYNRRQGSPNRCSYREGNAMIVAAMATTYLVKLKVIAGSGIGSIHAIPRPSRRGREQS